LFKGSFENVPKHLDRQTAVDFLVDKFNVLTQQEFCEKFGIQFQDHTCITIQLAETCGETSNTQILD
jgi:hypothetical protein